MKKVLYPRGTKSKDSKRIIVIILIQEISDILVLNISLLGNFSCSCCRLLTFFKINFFKKFFEEQYQTLKRFGSRLGTTFCWS